MMVKFDGGSTIKKTIFLQDFATESFPEAEDAEELCAAKKVLMSQ